MLPARLFLFVLLLPVVSRAAEPLFDWSEWKRYRSTVSHPSLTIKPADLKRARENIRRYDWAKQYADALHDKALAYAARFTPRYVERMLEQTTPLASIFTPCP